MGDYDMLFDIIYKNEKDWFFKNSEGIKIYF
jgi:hypothetical protein